MCGQRTMVAKSTYGFHNKLSMNKNQLHVWIKVLGLADPFL